MRPVRSLELEVHSIQELLHASFTRCLFIVAEHAGILSLHPCLIGSGTPHVDVGNFAPQHISAENWKTPSRGFMTSQQVRLHPCVFGHPAESCSAHTLETLANGCLFHDQRRRKLKNFDNQDTVRACLGSNLLQLCGACSLHVWWWTTECLVYASW